MKISLPKQQKNSPINTSRRLESFLEIFLRFAWKISLKILLKIILRLSRACKTIQSLCQQQLAISPFDGAKWPQRLGNFLGIFLAIFLGFSWQFFAQLQSWHVIKDASMLSFCHYRVVGTFFEVS